MKRQMKLASSMTPFSEKKRGVPSCTHVISNFRSLALMATGSNVARLTVRQSVFVAYILDQSSSMKDAMELSTEKAIIIMEETSALPQLRTQASGVWSLECLNASLSRVHDLSTPQPGSRETHAPELPQAMVTTAVKQVLMMCSGCFHGGKSQI